MGARYPGFLLLLALVVVGISSYDFPWSEDHFHYQKFRPILTNRVEAMNEGKGRNMESLDARKRKSPSWRVIKRVAPSLRVMKRFGMEAPWFDEQGGEFVNEYF